GMAGRAVVDARAGRSLAAAFELAAAGVFLLALLGLWSVNLDRLLTTVVPSSALRGRRELRRTQPSLFPSVARFLPRTRIGAVAASALTGGWSYVPLAACLGVAVLGCQLGVGNVTSVRLAQPLPESATNPWATRSGHGLSTGLLLLGAFLVSGLLLAPVAGLV